MFVLFFIIIIADIVKFINRGLCENLISHSTTIIFYHGKMGVIPGTIRINNRTRENLRA